MKNHFLPKNVHAKFNTFTAYTNIIYTRAKSKAVIYIVSIYNWLLNSSWLLICFRSSEEDHIWIPSCRSGLHQNSIQQRRDFRTFNKYVWWKDTILALWILHIFFEQFKKLQVILWEILYTTSICLKLWCKIIGWKYITWLLSIYYTLTNFHAKYRKLNTTYLQYYLYFFYFS